MSSASFSPARAAIRRACSSGVSEIRQSLVAFSSSVAGVDTGAGGRHHAQDDAASRASISGGTHLSTPHPPTGRGTVSRKGAQKCASFVPTRGALTRMPRPTLASERRISIPVETETIDLDSDRARNEIVDRQPGTGSLAYLLRRDRMGGDRKERDALRPIERRQNRLQLLVGVAGPVCDGERSQLQHPVGLAPAQEAGELVGADEKGQIVVA